MFRQNWSTLTRDKPGISRWTKILIIDFWCKCCIYLRKKLLVWNTYRHFKVIYLYRFNEWHYERWPLTVSLAIWFPPSNYNTTLYKDVTYINQLTKNHILQSQIQLCYDHNKLSPSGNTTQPLTAFGNNKNSN